MQVFFFWLICFCLFVFLFTISVILSLTLNIQMIILIPSLFCEVFSMSATMVGDCFALLCDTWLRQAQK